MNNEISASSRFHEVIETKHVYIEDEQVFLKRRRQEVGVEDSTVAEWFPTDFKWEPVRF